MKPIGVKKGLPQHARVRAVLRSREGSLPNQKRSSGGLCVSRLSFGVQEEPPIGYRSGSGPAKRNEHIRWPVIARIASVQAAAHKSWIAAAFPFQSKWLRSASRDLR